MARLTPHRYFPVSGIAVARMPKAGCTSLTRWAAAVEQAAAGATPVDMPPGIWGIKRIDEVPAGTLRLATLRHPVDRIVSAYANKLLRAPQGVWILSYLGQRWFPTLRSFQEVRMHFGGFVERLATDHEFRNVANLHWRPQGVHVPNLKDFDLVVSMERLDELPAMVAQRRPDLPWVADVPMRRENVTELMLVDYLLNPELVALIESTYAADLALLDHFGISRAFHRKVGIDPPAECDLDAEVRRLRADRRRDFHEIIDRYLDRFEDGATGPGEIDPAG